MTQQTAYERILDALRDAGSSWRDQAGYIIAQCPAHDDRDPSLSIKAIEGSVLLKCHAGCEVEDILRALNLELADLYDDRKGARYPYGDGRIVDRTPDKQFRQSGTRKPTGGALFHAERIRDAELVYVVEGEKDVLAVEAVGGVAVCSAMGAGKADRADWTPLRGRRVIIVADDDRAGYNHADDIARILEPLADEVRIVRAAEGKDAADHIAAGHSLAELVDITPDPLAKAHTTAWLGSQAFPPLEYHVPGIVPEGLGVLAAPPKSGKSWLVFAIAIAVSCGGAALGHITVPRARPILYMALEDGNRRLQERGKAIGNGDQAWANENLTYVTENDSGWNGALLTMHTFLRRHRRELPLIIVDTFGRIRPPRPAGADAYQHDYATAAQLKQLVDTVPGASMLMVHHTRKAETADYVDSISGTYGLPAAADYLLVLKHKRHARDAILSVTGRDVTEAEYALETSEGLWQLVGDDLKEAENEAYTRQITANLGERALEVLHLVNSREQTVTTARDVTEELGLSKDQATVYLNRLAERGRIAKTGRGKFAPNNVPVISVGDVISPDFSEHLSHNKQGHLDLENGQPSEADRFSEPRAAPRASKPPPAPPAPRCQNCDTPLSQPASIRLGLCAECKLLALNLDPEDPNYPKWSPHGDI